MKGSACRTEVFGTTSILANQMPPFTCHGPCVRLDNRTRTHTRRWRSCKIIGELALQFDRTNARNDAFKGDRCVGEVQRE